LKEKNHGKKIVAAGNVCLDITPVFEQVSKMDMSQIFLPGKLIGVGPAQMHAGGSISNTGLAFRYFGSEVTVMAKVGMDNFGKTILDMVDKVDVCNEIRICEECDTSYTIVMAPPGIDRIFFHCPGANDTFGYDDIDFDIVEQADLFHFGYPTIMRKLYENPQELVAIFKKAKEIHTYTSLDLAAITEDAEAASTDWCAVFRELLPYVDYFVPSAEELCFLIDRPRYKEWLKRAAGRDVTEVLDWKTDIRPLADMLMQWDAKIVLIKCGTPGMYLRTRRMEGARTPEKKAWDDVEIFERSYKAEKFCSATGAGDVSIAAFLTAALNGYIPQRCLQLATGAGACCVTDYDALGGLIPFDKMIEKIDCGWEKN
jgi:sugar/nucleoside kinase (ribokinase family)